MKRYFVKAALLGVTAGASLCAADQNVAAQSTPNNQNNIAWQRKTPDECRKDDEAAFNAKLSPYTHNFWRDFTPDQRKKAMDYADKNKMDPDAAVEKVQMEKKKM